MKNLSWLCLLIVISVSCNDPEPRGTDHSGTTSTDTAIATIQIPKTGCYEYVSGEDTVTLKVETFPNVVTGLLKYNFREKDRNTGEIDGRISGDTLIADYRFLSEGVRSVRQVAFLIKDSIATEGYGDMQEKEGKMVFSDPHKIDFSSGIRLTKKSCVE